MRVATAFALLSAILVGPHPAAAQVETSLHALFGKDDRVFVVPEGMPWSAVGKLTFRGSGHCSGSMVSPRVVLTAAHCLFAERGGPVFDPPTTFLAGYHMGRYAAEAEVEAYWVSKDYDYERFLNSSSVDGLDYAFILLSEPIGHDVGHFVVHELSSDEIEQAVARQWATITQAGYSGDSEFQLTAHIGCLIVDYYNDNTISHECDTLPGDSGSPIFVKRDGEYEVIALDSAVYGGARPNNIAVDSRAFAADLQRFVEKYDSVAAAAATPALTLVAGGG
ncbi:MAG: trypsin-like serine protease [Inquilinus sp.]|nr:trypsin-like serine protease [Inquilinus sp.]